MKEEEHSNQLLLCHICACAMYISLIVCNPLIPTDSSKSHLGSDMPSALGLVGIMIGGDCEIMIVMTGITIGGYCEIMIVAAVNIPAAWLMA